MHPSFFTASSSAHVVVLPYPGRSHINAIFNLCRHLLSSSPSLRITSVVTDEWLHLLSTHHLLRHPRFHVRSIPNVIPSEHDRAANFLAFLEAVLSRMERPFEDLLSLLHPPPSAILADTFMPCAVDVAARRGVPAYSFFPMSPTFFSLLLHHDLLGAWKAEEHVGTRVPSITTLRFSHVDSMLSSGRVLELMLPCFSAVRKARGILFNACYALDPAMIDTLRNELTPLAVYAVGPLLPRGAGGGDEECPHDYMRWLDQHPAGSVLYVSFGSFMSVSVEQMEEIALGLRDSGMPSLWVARGEGAARAREKSGAAGIVVPWCEQLRVLCHASVGAFMSHCGWNSVLEAMFAGKPVIACPIAVDQQPNGGQVVEEWGVGLGVKEGVMAGGVVGRERIAEVARRVMGPEGEDIRRRAGAMKAKLREAVEEGGSSARDLHAFMDALCCWE